MRLDPTLVRAGFKASQALALTTGLLWIGATVWLSSARSVLPTDGMSDVKKQEYHQTQIFLIQEKRNVEFPESGFTIAARVAASR